MSIIEADYNDFLFRDLDIRKAGRPFMAFLLSDTTLRVAIIYLLLSSTNWDLSIYTRVIEFCE